jgi:hypothetical protein
MSVDGSAGEAVGILQATDSMMILLVGLIIPWSQVRVLAGPPPHRIFHGLTHWNTGLPPARKPLVRGAPLGFHGVMVLGPRDQGTLVCEHWRHLHGSSLRGADEPPGVLSLGHPHIIESKLPFDHIGIGLRLSGRGEAGYMYSPVGFSFHGHLV